MPENRALTKLLRQLHDRTSGKEVLVEELVEAVGHRAFPALILVPALIVISPVSGIPGVSTMAGITISVIAAQYICNRKSVWLPRIILRRSFPSKRLEQTIDFLRRPSSWVERLLKARLTFLAEKPCSLVLLVVIMLLGLLMPLLELVPFSSSIAAGAIALLSLSLLFRDGLLAVLAAGMLLFAGYFIYNAVLT